MARTGRPGRAIAVVDRSGTVVFSQLGGSHEQAEKVLRAVQAALAAGR